MVPIAPRFRRRLALAALGCAVAWAGAAAMSAAAAKIPPINGQLAGNFQPLQLAGAPEVHWNLAVESRGDNDRSAVFVAAGPGTHLRAEARLDAAGNGTWRLVEGKVELKPWLNGQITFGTADLSGGGTVQDGALSGELTLHLENVDLGEFIRFADPEQAYVRKAEGRVHGTIGVRFKNGAISAGPSGLALAPGTVATINFIPSPGLLTNYVPPLVLKQYPGISAIEMGLTPLEAKVLELTFFPEGDAQGRGAVVKVEGRPLDKKIISPLELEFNFTGPLESLIRKGLDSRLKIGGVSK